MQLQNYAEKKLERSFEPNRLFETINTHSTIAEHSTENYNDVENFLNRTNIRNRLTMLNNCTDQSTIPIVSLYDSINENVTNSSFKCTITIIMMPYINNNRIVTIHSIQ